MSGVILSMPIMDLISPERDLIIREGNKRMNFDI
jgi:hypothetical protein